MYDSPVAAVITNGRHSESFNLGRATRQGCPLSPLVFAMVIERLAEAVRCNLHISGILVNGKQHKIALYADGMTSFCLLLNQRSLFLMEIIERARFQDIKLTFLNWRQCL